MLLHVKKIHLYQSMLMLKNIYICLIHTQAYILSVFNEECWAITGEYTSASTIYYLIMYYNNIKKWKSRHVNYEGYLKNDIIVNLAIKVLSENTLNVALWSVC